MFSSRAIIRTLAVAAMLATANAQSALQTGMEMDAKKKVVSLMLGGAHPSDDQPGPTRGHT